MLDPKEEWVNVCELTDTGEIKFTKDFLDTTKELAGGARKFASHLISHWSKEFETLLDYFGPDEAETDWYSGIDGDPMDVREDVPDMWNYYEIPFEGLDTEWYRDVMRAKLVSLKLPKRLIENYVKVALKNMER